MCGISGEYRRGAGGAASGPGLLAARARLISHRGPDDAGTHFDGPVGFGFRRLSIIDLEHGGQPMVDRHTGAAIQFNGEIYNFRELRSELERAGRHFRTRSDTEVILQGYLEWGDGILDRLNGIFGFAIWDPRAPRLLIARDHFGVKPVYYSDVGGTLRFGSEMRTILADPAVPRVLDPDAVRILLHYGYLPSPFTLLSHVRKLGPGERLVATPGSIDIARYDDRVPDIVADIEDAEATEQYLELFRAAVERQMIADVEVGCLLSGGVDSGMVLGAASQLSDRPISTFTVSFGEAFEYDEGAGAAATARRFGSDHHELRIDVDDAEALLFECLDHLEEPVLSQSTFAYHLMNRKVSDHVKVVLTGQGVDEPWAGYDRYLAERYGRRLRRVFGSAPAAALSARFPGAERFRRAVDAVGITDPVDRFTAIHQVIDPDTVAAIGGPLLATATIDPREVMAVSQAPVTHLDEFSQLLHIDTRRSLADDLLLYGDKLSMSSSVEARVPFLDRDLMAFVESLPPRMKLRGRTAKFIHKRAAEAYLPREVIHRPKMGFATPIDQWFGRELVPLLDRTVLAPGSVCSDALDPAAIRRLVADHGAGRRNHRRQLTTLLNLEVVASQLMAAPVVPDVAPVAVDPPRKAAS